jgi:hypothetical protein
MRRALVFLLPVLVVLSGFGGEPKPEYTPEQILAKNIASRGGDAALRALTTRYRKYQYVDGYRRQYTVERWEKAPDKLLVVWTYDRQHSYRYGYDGSVGWHQEDDQKPRAERGDDLYFVQQEADLFEYLDWQKWYKTLEFVGFDQEIKPSPYIVRFVAKKGGDCWRYYDPQTFIEVKSKCPWHGGGGQMNAVSLYRDYRAVGGEMLPFQIDRQSASVTISINREEYNSRMSLLQVEIGKDLDDAIFAMPVKAAKK